MKVSALLAQFGPVLLEKYADEAAKTGADGEHLAQLRELGNVILHSVTDALLEQEITQDNTRKADDLAHLAADLLRGWPGEPTEQAAVDAVRVAKKLIDEAERVTKAAK